MKNLSFGIGASVAMALAACGGSNSQADRVFNSFEVVGTAFCECLPPAEVAACKAQFEFTDEVKACVDGVVSDMSSPEVDASIDCFVEVFADIADCAEPLTCAEEEALQACGGMISNTDNCPELPEAVDEAIEDCGFDFGADT